MTKVKLDYLGELIEIINEEHNRQQGIKALRIHNRCMRAGKTDLALKIKHKYGRKFPQFDLAIATGMLLFLKNNDKD